MTAVIVSLLLHFLALILIKSEVIDLQKIYPQIPEEEKRLVFEIVESNPESAVDTPPEDARFASDKNTRARDTSPESTPDSDRPLTTGVPDVREVPVPRNNAFTAFDPSILEKFQPPKEFKLSELVEKAAPTPDDQITPVEKPPSEKLMAVMPDNREISALESGGLSLSTYAWDFAPYMLDLKRKISRNMHPPRAFTELCIIDGSYIIQFIITREGTLSSLHVLDSQGGKPLELTSINAVKYSFPFKPLPENFPDNFLVVTGLFKYILK